MTAESKSQITPNHKALKRKLFLALLLSMPVWLGLGLVLYYAFWYERICPGVHIMKIDVGKKTLYEAKTLIEDELDEILNRKIRLYYDDESVSLALQSLGLEACLDEALAKAYHIGKQGPIWERAVELVRSLTAEMHVDLKWQWDEAKMHSTLVKNLHQFNRPSRDATFTITDDNFMYLEPEEPGREVDYSQLFDQLKRISIEDLKPVEIPVIIKDKPQVTWAMLQEQMIDGLLASYSTTFDHNLVNRTHNIRLAAQALDKVLIEPGASFSFNDTVGPRTSAAGYREAMVIVGNQFVPGIGGGICQVSSTLYNAFLLANLEIIERQNHSLAIDYVPLGQDATVAYPYVDLKARNNSGGYLYLRTYVEHNRLTIEIYGHVVPNREIRIENIAEAPKRVLTYRIVSINGEEVQRELISRSIYN